MSARCPACSHDNPDGARFCNGCGRSLASRCSACGAENPAGAKFCNACGAALDRAAFAVSRSPSPAPRDYTPKHLAEKILQSKSALEGERKQVTVLFADVKGSMALSGEAGEEVWHGILDRFFAILTDGVHRFEGTVNQYTGDGIMALFGAPIAHEDHAQRACYAALELRDRLREFAQELRRTQGLDFLTRIGLNSGEVIVGRIGDDLRMDYTAQGQTVGLAQRMEQLAEPGHIYTAPETARRVEGYFALGDLGEFRVKGIAGALHVFELEGVGTLRTRFDAARARGLSKFVGRTAELATLDAALARATAGQGNVIGIVAEAGTGKSRLCFEFVERCRARGLTVHQSAAPSHGRNIPLTPILELFRSAFGIATDDDPAEACAKVAGRLLLLDETLRAVLPSVFDFLGIAGANRNEPRSEEDSRQRQLFAVLRRLLKNATAERPAITLIEDLHWLDDASERWLAEWVDAIQGCHALLIVNFRPEYHAEWMHAAHCQRLALAPLDAATFRELLTELLGRDASMHGLAEAIHARTQGNPFFAEEVVHALVESGQLDGAPGAYRLAVPAARIAVPDDVRAVLAARMDRLPDAAKRLLQTAAVIGTEFAEPLLAAVVDAPRDALAASLSALERADFVRTEALYPIATYAFKHPLTQEVALGSQLAEARKRTHAKVARAIEAATPAQRLDSVAATLAHHCEQAGEILAAARWHTRAAQAFYFAQDEARDHWAEVRRLCRTLEETEDVRALAIEAHVGLWRWNFVNAARLSSLSEFEPLLVEGRELCLRAHDYDSLFDILEGYGMSNNSTRMGESARAAAVVSEMRACAQQTRDPSHAWRAELRALIGAMNHDLREAGRLSEGIAELVERPGRLIRTGGVPLFLSQRALVRTWAGRLDHAERDIDRAVRDIVRIENPIPTWWLCVRAELAVAKGDQRIVARDEQAARQAIQRGYETVVQHRILQGHFVCAVASALRGDWHAAAQEFEQVIAAAHGHAVAGHQFFTSYSRLAEARLELGHEAGARAAIAEGLEKSIAWPIFEALARIVLARIERRTRGAAGLADAEAALARADALVAQTGARLYEPDIHIERAALCEFIGDGDGRLRHLRDAQRLLAEFGAPVRAEAIATRG